MHPLTEKQIRASFVNASRREAAQAVLPDLDALAWDDLDLLGWSDRKAPLQAYVVLELDGVPTGVRFRTPTADRGRMRRGAVCTWCQDVRTTEAVLVAARRGGASGKAGNTVGTLVCEHFDCSAHARWTPPRRDPDPATVAADLAAVAERVAGLRERSAAFVRLVAATA